MSRERRGEELSGQGWGKKVECGGKGLVRPMTTPFGCIVPICSFCSLFQNTSLLLCSRLDQETRQSVLQSTSHQQETLAVAQA